MARKDTTHNGHDRLEEAMAMLIPNQTAFLSRSAESDRRLSEIERAASERFARAFGTFLISICVKGLHSRAPASR